MKVTKIINALFTATILLAVIVIVVSTLPIPGGYKLLIVQSGSMEPAIKTGSVVIVKPEMNYKAGDVITFSDKGKSTTVTHRIINIETAADKTYFITKGDANKKEDTEKVSREKVIGKVQASIPYAGYVFAAAKKPLGFVFLVIVPCAIIIFEEVLKINKELKKKRESKRPDDTREIKGESV